MTEVWRVSWETGSSTKDIRQHAVDYLTETAANVRMETLKAAGISRRVVYRAEGDGMRRCWCSEHATKNQEAG